MTCCICGEPAEDIILEGETTKYYCSRHHLKQLSLLGFCRTSSLLDKDGKYVENNNE